MKVKVLTSAAVTLAFIAGVASPAFAIEGSATPRPTAKPTRTEIKQRVEELKKQAEVKKDKRSERVQKFWDNMKRRLEILVRNQNKLADRIEKSIDQRAAKGRDVTELKAKLAEARAKIAEAEAALKDADGKVAGIIAGNEPKEALKKVNELNKEVLAKIRAAHQSLVDVLKIRKGEKPSPSVSPSVSPTVSPTPAA
jgi:chromosome segregation ATPase